MTTQVFRENGNYICDYNEYIQYFDACYHLAGKGDIDAAEAVSKFYTGLIFGDRGHTAKSKFIHAYNIGKKFARLAAYGGNPRQYIFLTGLDYGAGKEMVECNRWMVREMVNLPYDSYQILAYTNSLLEPQYIDKETLGLLEDFISHFYCESGEIRVAKANMYRRGFFGSKEKNKVKALRIACSEWRLSQQKGSKNERVRLSSAFVIYELVFGWCNFSKNTDLANLAHNSHFSPMDHEFQPFKFIKRHTHLFQYYMLMPERMHKKIHPPKEMTIHLDLHSLSKGESIEQTTELLKLMILNRYDITSSLIITGRGNHSPGNAPVIKPSIKQLLEKVSKDKTFSIGYCEAKGEGAFRVWLRR
jgi:hypothetical protein